MRSTGIVMIALLPCACAGGPEDPSAAPGGPAIRLVSRYLDLGSVPAEEARTVHVVIANDGDAPLVVRDLDLSVRLGDGWRADPLLEPLRIEAGMTEEVTVVFHACPALWNGAERRADADPCACLSHVASAVVVLDTNAGEAEAELLATVLPPSPQLSLRPETVLDLEPSGDGALTGTVTLENVGCRDLTLRGIELTGPGGADERGAFTSPACPDWPCLANRTLCAPGRPGCDAPVLSLPVRNENTGAVASQLAELRVESDDPLAPVQVLLLRAAAPECLAPIATIRLDTEHPCVGAPVALSATLLDADTSTIVRRDWHFLFSPGPAPSLTTDGDFAEFVPSLDGSYVLGFVAENACGAASSRAELAVQVRDSCR